MGIPTRIHQAHCKGSCRRTEAEYSVAERFRRGNLHYRYRASNGELHHDDLSDDFRREADIDFATATATRPGRIVSDPNPKFPCVRGNFTPKPQWVGEAFSPDFDPFSRPDFIAREFPAEAITELNFLVSRMPTVEPAGKSAPLDVKDSLSVEVDAPAPRPRLTGKAWVAVAFKRRAEELGPKVMNITDAGHALSNESKTAPDCAKPLSKGYCINLLRNLDAWPKKHRNSPK
jgi:hypothetical protein